MAKSSNRLKTLQKLWKKAEPKKIGAPLPPDDYVARIDNAVIGESRNGRTQIDWTLTIIGGDYEGKIVHRYTGLETEENLSYLQGDLEVLELQVPDSIDDLGEVLTEAAGIMVDITVAKNNEYVNIYFNDVVEGDEEVEEEEDEEIEEEEEEAEEEEDAEEEEEVEYEKGDRVLVDIDGEDYAGEIKKMKKNSAIVDFDDGDEMDVKLEDLNPEEEED